MYIVSVHEPKGPYPYSSPGIAIHGEMGGSILKFSLKSVLGGISSLTLKIPLSNNHANKLEPYKTLIKLRNYETKKTLFRGRVLDKNYSMDSSGKVIVTYTCEDQLAFLHDSTQKWRKVQNTTIKDFLGLLLKEHNSKVEDYKKIKLGEVTVQNNTDNVYRYVGYGTTFDEIKDNLTSRLGGHLRLRQEGNGLYLDYLESINEKSDTPIMLSKNLKSFKKQIDPTEIISRVYVYGKTLEDENNTDIGVVSAPRLDMSSVNGGKTYLEDKELIDEFGIQEGVLTYNDISKPKNLLRRAKSFFEGQRAAKQTYNVEAVDLSLLDKTIDQFEVGKWYDVITYPLLNLEDTLQVIEVKMDSENPQRNSLKIGDQSVTLSQYQANNRKSQETIKAMEGMLMTQSASHQNRYSALENKYNNDKKSLEEQIAELEKRLKESKKEDNDQPGGGTTGPSKSPVFPVDYSRSGINFWTSSNGMYYGAPRSGGRRHAGFDIGGGGSSHPIYAVQDGVVTWAGSKGSGLGIYVTIRHTGDEYHTLYGHLSRASVSTGTRVKRGQQIGMMGATGGNYAIHLHIELSKTGRFHTIANTTNPAPYLGVTTNNRTNLQRPTRI